MIKIKFKIDAKNPIDEFEMGDMSIEIDNTSVTSKEKVPSQSMMVFVSITQLLDSLFTFFSQNKKEVEFCAADSSFALKFRRVKKNKVSLSYSKKEFAVVNDGDLKEEVLRAAIHFFNEYGKDAVGSGAAVSDLADAINDFKAVV